jgi:hypothetical protein
MHGACGSSAEAPWRSGPATRMCSTRTATYARWSCTSAPCGTTTRAASDPTSQLPPNPRAPASVTRAPWGSMVAWRFPSTTLAWACRPVVAGSSCRRRRGTDHSTFNGQPRRCSSLGHCSDRSVCDGVRYTPGQAQRSGGDPAPGLWMLLRGGGVEHADIWRCTRRHPGAIECGEC